MDDETSTFELDQPIILGASVRGARRHNIGSRAQFFYILRRFSGICTICDTGPCRYRRNDSEKHLQRAPSLAGNPVSPSSDLGSFAPSIDR
jgi:hypothetical protein